MHMYSKANVLYLFFVIQQFMGGVDSELCCSWCSIFLWSLLCVCTEISELHLPWNPLLSCPASLSSCSLLALLSLPVYSRRGSGRGGRGERRRRRMRRVRSAVWNTLAGEGISVSLWEPYWSPSFMIIPPSVPPRLLLPPPSLPSVSCDFCLHSSSAGALCGTGDNVNDLMTHLAPWTATVQYKIWLHTQASCMFGV